MSFSAHDICREDTQSSSEEVIGIGSLVAEHTGKYHGVVKSVVGGCAIVATLTTDKQVKYFTPDLDDLVYLYPYNLTSSDENLLAMHAAL